MCGASKIIGVDLNPVKEDVGKSLFHLWYNVVKSHLF
uniref:Uncharacterized protein n=1 Tax=Arundo donax TaxID=35708 RepID=A0A0A9FAR7_ARUDO